MARILLLVTHGEKVVAVNTMNIATLAEDKDDGEHTIWTTDGEATGVFNAFDDIIHAWRHGVDAGNVKVFDDVKV